jgi:hypothetical protein
MPVEEHECSLEGSPYLTGSTNPSGYGQEAAATVLLPNLKNCTGGVRGCKGRRWGENVKRGNLKGKSGVGDFKMLTLVLHQ